MGAGDSMSMYEPNDPVPPGHGEPQPVDTPVEPYNGMTCAGTTHVFDWRVGKRCECGKYRDTR
jgi:hypothetical protein